MDDNNQVKKVSVSGNCTLATIIQVVFIVLKLMGKISWSWVLVLMPTIVTAGIMMIFLIIGIITLLCAMHRE